jgi:hypothetical protein
MNVVGWVERNETHHFVRAMRSVGAQPLYASLTPRSIRASSLRSLTTSK